MYDLITLTNMAKEIVLPEGWEVDKIEGGKIILKEVKPKYPKTWEECVNKLEKIEFIDACSLIYKIDLSKNGHAGNKYDRNSLPIGYGRKVLDLCQLLICRNVYWGDWRPNWEDTSRKYCIIVTMGSICKTINMNRQSILGFPTEEMRDTFYENFIDLIEEAKDLL